MFEFLDYVNYFMSRRKAPPPRLILPESTYTDVVWTCLGVVLTARIYLLKWEATGYENEIIVQPLQH